MESYDLYSYFCLFDECCLSKYKRETNHQLIRRLSKLSYKMCWLVNDITNSKEKRYATCIYHTNRIMENICLTQIQLGNLTHECLRNMERLNINCFSFFQDDEIIVHDFCISCKVFFLVLDEFNLKKIVINDGVIR